MPIYMEVEGIKGNVTGNGLHGGANFALSDGSVRNMSRSSGHKFTLERTFNSGGGPRVNVFSGTDRAGSSNDGGILVSSVSVPNLPNGLIDSRDAKAVFKAGLLFEGMKNLIVARGLILLIPRSGANKLRHTNNIKQLGLAAFGRFPAVKLVITDGSGNPTSVQIELENVLITNYSISGAGGDASASGTLFNEALAGEGKTVKIDF